MKVEMAKSRETTHPNAAAFPPGMSGPSLRALATARVTSLAALAKKTEAEIAALHGMGPTGVGILKAEMKRRKLKFRAE